MASDRQVLLGTTLAQFARFRLDAESPPDPHKRNAGASAPSLSVTVTELPSPPASPASPATSVDAVGPAAPEPIAPARAAPNTFACFPLLPAELRLNIW